MTKNLQKTASDLKRPFKSYIKEKLAGSLAGNLNLRFRSDKTRQNGARAAAPRSRAAAPRKEGGGGFPHQIFTGDTMLASEISENEIILLKNQHKDSTIS
jgi:hypothetical protein